MRKLSYLLFAVFVFAISLSAQDEGLGLGFKIGEPTGLTGKYWLSRTNAVDFTIGAAVFKKNSSIHLSATYLFHNYNLIESDLKLPVFYGFGVDLLTRKIGSSSFGIKAVGGIAWMSEDPELPIDIFCEIAPVFRLFPTAGLDLDASIGARYYF